MLTSQREEGDFEDQVYGRILYFGPRIRQWPTDFLEKWRDDLERCSSAIKKADPELWTVSARGNLTLMQAQDYLCEEWLRLVKADLYQRSPEASIAQSKKGLLEKQRAQAQQVRPQPAGTVDGGVQEGDAGQGEFRKEALFRKTGDSWEVNTREGPII